MATRREFSLSVAARHLDTSPAALRKLFARASKTSDGGSEARVDGVRARKRGNCGSSSLTRDGELGRWRSAENVARDLGYTPGTLRRTLQRRRAAGLTGELTLRGGRCAVRMLGDRWKPLLQRPTPAGPGEGGPSDV